jgi:hypothetical protein
MKSPLPFNVSGLIHTMRGEKVILDADLAHLYGVTTGRLNEAVTRNKDRFPADFRFQLTTSEWSILKSQIAIAKSGSGGRQLRPWVFTEHGALMAANVLRSQRAIQMSIFVVRAFLRMRNVLSDTVALAAKLDKLESEVTARLDSHEKSIVELMRQFLTIINPENETQPDEASPRREIGFHVKDSGNRKDVRSKRAR